ncbi:uncharacterized protein LOC114530746 isoform X1 [Dendronephthya gigantea]|uniref:uncharacterized protein LOC114530746 isoform X1 n=1 Tax=Dendronephthya gigantea TaxID=151771 RepID=UPI00106B22E2|nr:uncharacterized protein LOC114530746 isoform X1 [Dendronephthya gigantea]
MNKPTIFFVFCLMAILKLFSVVNCKMDEEGTRYFNKKISVKDNTTSFIVQKYNEVLNDFNLGLTITRVPDVGICHIKPLEKNLPNPGKLKVYIDFLKKLNGSSEGRSSLLGASSSEWIIDKRLETKDLKPQVLKFCGRLPVYSMKEISKNINDDFQTFAQALFMKSFDRTGRRGKRSMNFPLCPNGPKTSCNPNDWILDCKFRSSGRAVCYEHCALQIKDLNRDLRNCNFSLRWSSVVCCTPVCLTR